MIDFTNCPRVEGRAYNGANGKKIAVVHDNEVYMLKFPPTPTQRGVELSYTNSCVSEHMCCRIFESAGISAQKTVLGTFTIKGKEKIVCACKDFTENNKTFFDFSSIKNTVIDSEMSGKGTELKSIIEAIKLQTKVDSTSLMNFYFDMFVMDALVGNFDRHNGNFGFLFNRDTSEYEIAPVYDCGSCLLPQADDDKLKEILNHRGEFNARIFNFPLSTIRENDTKINYYDFISSMKNEHCNAAVKRITPKIDMNVIGCIIDGVECATPIQKEFYKAFLKARFELILQPTLSRLQEANLVQPEQPKPFKGKLAEKNRIAQEHNVNRETPAKLAKSKEEEI
jgi:hypothetical protein